MTAEAKHVSWASVSAFTEKCGCAERRFEGGVGYGVGHVSAGKQSCKALGIPVRESTSAGRHAQPGALSAISRGRTQAQGTSASPRWLPAPENRSVLGRVPKSRRESRHLRPERRQAPDKHRARATIPRFGGGPDQHLQGPSARLHSDLQWSRRSSTVERTESAGRTRAAVVGRATTGSRSYRTRHARRRRSGDPDIKPDPACHRWAGYRQNRGGHRRHQACPAGRLSCPGGRTHRPPGRDVSTASTGRPEPDHGNRPLGVPDRPASRRSIHPAWTPAQLRPHHLGRGQPDR